MHAGMQYFIRISNTLNTVIVVQINKVLNAIRQFGKRPLCATKVMINAFQVIFKEFVKYRSEFEQFDHI